MTSLANIMYESAIVSVILYKLLAVRPLTNAGHRLDDEHEIHPMSRREQENSILELVLGMENDGVKRPDMSE